MEDDERGCYEFNPTEEFPEEFYPEHLFDQHGYSCERCDYTPDYCIEGEWGTSMNSIGPEFFECDADASWRVIRACGFPIPLCDNHKQTAERSTSSYVDKGDRMLRFEPYNRNTANDNFSESYYHHGYRDNGKWTWEDDCHCGWEAIERSADESSGTSFWTLSPSPAENDTRA